MAQDGPERMKKGEEGEPGGENGAEKVAEGEREAVRMNKKLLLLCLLLLPLTGCGRDLLPRSRDITTVELMQVLALDEGEGDKLRVTAASGVRSGGQSGETQSPVVLSREASTVLAACMGMQGSASGYASFSHVEQVVLSAQAAQRSTAGLLDYLERDPEMRLDTQVWLTEGQASEVIQGVREGERSAAELLEALGRELKVESCGWPVSVRELLIDLEDNGCALLPVVELYEEAGEPCLRCVGMGWLQEDDYRETLTPEQSRSAALLEGKLDSGAVSIGAQAGLRLTGSRCRWTPLWDGDRLRGISIKVEVRSDLAELQGGATGTLAGQQALLRSSLEARLEKELRSLLQRSRQAGGDFLHLQRRMRLLCPQRYRAIDRNWARWFPALELDVRVHSRVERSYDLNGGVGA